ncbi:MAG: DUF1801 domain-containing protein [Verrucomicrobiota bacterium]|jgi:hypothetical protein
MPINKTHGSFEDILRAAGPRLRPLCQALRNLVASLDKDFVEVVWLRQEIASFGVGPKKMTEHYAYIGIQSSYVNLGFYHGAALRDPTHLLEGTGKRLRHVKIRTDAEVKNAAIAALLRNAIDSRRKHKHAG